MSSTLKVARIRTARLFCFTTIGADLGAHAAFAIMAHYPQLTDARAVFIACAIGGGAAGGVAELGWRIMRASKLQFGAKQMLIEATIVIATIGIITAMARYLLR